MHHEHVSYLAQLSHYYYHPLMLIYDQSDTADPSGTL